LLNIYAAVLPHADDGLSNNREAILDRVKNMSWGEFKPVLADAIVAHLQPIQERYAQIRANGDADLDAILADGAAAANAVASQTLYAAKVAMGLVVVPPASPPK
jgi:tryptophanyl-tRNA synthetase